MGQEVEGRSINTEITCHLSRGHAGGNHYDLARASFHLQLRSRPLQEHSLLLRAEAELAWGKAVLESGTGCSTVLAVRQLSGPPGLTVGTRKDPFSHHELVGSCEHLCWQSLTQAGCTEAVSTAGARTSKHAEGERV